MLKVLGRGTSGNVQKVVWLLEELALPYAREDYGRQFNNTGGDYLKLNPNGKVPTLDDNGTIVWESNTILRYLANKNGGKFYPSDPAARSEVERWMDWQLARSTRLICRSSRMPRSRRPSAAPAGAPTARSWAPSSRSWTTRWPAGPGWRART